MAHPIDSKINGLTALSARMAQAFPKGGSGGSEALKALCSEVGALLEGAIALRDLHSTRNPTETDGAHTKRVATDAQRFAKKIEAARERAAKLAKDGLGNIAAQIRAKTQLVPDRYETEMRAQFRLLSSTERLKLLGELIEEKRGAEFAAIVNAPRFLTGMTETLRQHYEAAFVAKHAAAELAGQKFDAAVGS